MELSKWYNIIHDTYRLGFYRKEPKMIQPFRIGILGSKEILVEMSWLGFSFISSSYRWKDRKGKGMTYR